MFPFILLNIIYFGQAELDKVISENGPVESGISTDGKNSSKKSKTDEQKHHSLLLQVGNAHVGFLYAIFVLILSLKHLCGNVFVRDFLSITESQL